MQRTQASSEHHYFGRSLIEQIAYICFCCSVTSIALGNLVNHCVRGQKLLCGLCYRLMTSQVSCLEWMLGTESVSSARVYLQQLSQLSSFFCDLQFCSHNVSASSPIFELLIPTWWGGKVQIYLENSLIISLFSVRYFITDTGRVVFAWHVTKSVLVGVFKQKSHMVVFLTNKMGMLDLCLRCSTFWAESGDKESKWGWVSMRPCITTNQNNGEADRTKSWTLFCPLRNLICY